MGAFLSQIVALLTVPTGNFIYHLVLVFSVAAALQSAVLQWRSSEFPQVRRAIVGLGLLLAAQVLLFGVSGLAWQGLLNPAATLPVLDRALMVFSIIWITWLWAFPEPSRPADAAAVLLTLLLGAAAGLNLLIWAPRASLQAFNLSIDDLLWQAASICLLIIAVLTLITRRPNGFGNGLALAGILLIGHVLHLFVYESGSFSGILRLAYVASFPMLLTIPQRFPASAAGSSLAGMADTTDRRPAQPRLYSAEPKTVHALLAVASESSALKVSQAITRAIAQTMLADLCFLVYLTDNKNQITIASGYDLIREESLEGGNLKRNAVPMLTNAIQRGRPLRLPASGTSADIKGITEILGLPNPGNTMSVPILTPEKEPLGAVLVVSPYSNRPWSAEDQTFLATLAAALVPIMQRSQKVNKLEQQSDQARQGMVQAQELAQEQLADAQRHTEELERSRQELQARNDELTRQIEAMKLQGERDTVADTQLAEMISIHEQSQRTIEQLQAELQAVRRNGKSVEPQMMQDPSAGLSDVARLQNQLAESNRKILELEKGSTPERRKSEQPEVIASISQELRQPMSSIIGYTDLLLGESVGILGALQRKFVERIKASTERMGGLMNDMIQLNTLEVGLADLKPESMDLNLIIDNALAYTSSQIREKNISMHLDLPKKVAPVNADREALQQILIHLLQNAGAATPVEGTIRLKVQTTNEGGKDYVLIQVTDSGGGIPEEDLARVFTRLYRADNVLIQGVGDTGVGLSIARTLTEAQHGRIWVESEPGIGATFSVLLPIEEPAVKATKDNKP
ncbi:MAG TPA: GAF domain-containing sensor histidine kinase [Anaerolineales bacterium]